MRARDEQRLRPLDQASVPEVWSEIERRGTIAGNSKSDPFAPGTEPSPRRRITAAVVGLALGGAGLLLAFNVFQGPNNGTVAPPLGIFFPTLKEPANGYPAALAAGTLTDSNGCIMLQNEGIETLLIWPYGTTLERDDAGTLRILRSDGSLIAEVGEYVRVGGGLVGEAAGEVAFAEQLIGESIPSRCRVDAGYFLTSGETLPGGPSVNQ